MKLQKLQKKCRALRMLIIFAVLTVSGLAYGEQKIALKADKGGKGAKGEVAIADTKPGQKELTITMSGLKPDSVYTVWLVNMKPKMDMAGVGTGDYSFKSDNKGVAKYSATISSAELEKWQMFEIAYHPDGDAKDMKKMQIALSGPIKMAK
jgi:hypothetical protein